jgi:tetratricopeptide (TPR) repeat protein
LPLGDYETALAYCVPAVSGLHELGDPIGEAGDRYSEADALTNLGDNYDAAGDRDAALTAWTQALTIFDELGHPRAEQLRATLLAGDRAGTPH